MASKGSSTRKKEKYKSYEAAKTAQRNKARRMIRDAKRSENWEEVLKKNLDANKDADVRKFVSQIVGKNV